MTDLRAEWRRTRVYCSGPLTTGNQFENVIRAVQSADVLRDRGYAVVLPHVTILWHLISPRPYEDWLENDLEWVRASDCVYRMPGESAGADRESLFAQEHGIPVYYSLDTLFAAEPGRRP